MALAISSDGIGVSERGRFVVGSNSPSCEPSEPSESFRLDLEAGPKNDSNRGYSAPSATSLTCCLMSPWPRPDPPCLLLVVAIKL